MLRYTQPVLILAAALFLPLSWPLALADATTPLVQYAGVWGCAGYAAAIAIVSAWLAVSAFIELNRRL